MVNLQSLVSDTSYNRSGKSRMWILSEIFNVMHMFWCGKYHTWISAFAFATKIERRPYQNGHYYFLLIYDFPVKLIISQILNELNDAENSRVLKLSIL